MKVSSGQRARAAAGGLTLAALAAASLAANGTTYHLVDLGEAYAVGINDAHKAAGNRLGDTQPLRWGGARWHDLKQVPNTFGSAAYAINHFGDVSGYIENAGLAFVPAIWPRGTNNFVLLPLPDGASAGIATAITTNRRAAGYTFDGSCVVWDANWNVTDIGKPRHTGGCQATGMNIDGDVTVNASGHGFVWRDGHYKDIGSLGGEGSSAMAINRYGHVAGTGTDAAGIEHPIVWKAGTMTDLGFPDSSYVDVVARALNDNGAVVGDGWSNNDEAQHAVLFDQGQAIVLDTVVDDLADWNLEYATGIANDGTIVGWGVRSTYYTHAFMLVPMASD